jgi:hypothetical protein
VPSAIIDSSLDERLAFLTDIDRKLHFRTHNAYIGNRIVDSYRQAALTQQEASTMLEVVESSRDLVLYPINTNESRLTMDLDPNGASVGFAIDRVYRVLPNCRNAHIMARPLVRLIERQLPEQLRFEQMMDACHSTKNLALLELCGYEPIVNHREFYLKRSSHPHVNFAPHNFRVL